MMEQLSEIQKIFPRIMELITLLLVYPSSSVTCEHGFSKLRTLNRWLRYIVYYASRLKALLLALIDIGKYPPRNNSHN